MFHNNISEVVFLFQGSAFSQYVHIFLQATHLYQIIEWIVSLKSCENHRLNNRTKNTTSDNISPHFAHDKFVLSLA